jgi:hypothetical protein
MRVTGLHGAGHGRVALVPFLAAFALAALSGASVSRPAHATSSADALAALPAPAQAAISRVLGRDQHAYRVSTANDAPSFRNDAQSLSARFDRSGVEVRSGATRLNLSLRALGYGKRLASVAPATPVAQANRVSYRRGLVTEWYLNGPLGLEQGFTLRRAPEHGSGPLTLKLALSSATPRLEGRTGLSFEASSLRYQGLFAADARGRRLPAWLELNGQTLLVRVDDAQARYPVTIDPFVQQAKLTASEAVDDQFGTSIAVSGDTVVAGAPSADVGGNLDQGAAYVFVKPGGGWANGAQTARLTASDGAANDKLGNSVAVSGDTVVAGAPFAGATKKGAAYVFEKPAGGWTTGTQTAKLTASDGLANDNLGYSVAVDGATVVAGAVAVGADVGAAYVFVKPGAVWINGTQIAKLTASDAAGGDRLGGSVGVSVNTVVAGAAGANPGGLNDRGAAYVFVKPVLGWASGTEMAKLTALDGLAGDNLGYSVAVSGDTVVAGAPFADFGSTDRGAAYVFVKPAVGWLTGPQTARLTASDGALGDALGFSVAVSGDTVIAGALGAAGAQGAAYVFVKPGGVWMNGTQMARLSAADGAADDNLGTSVAVSGDTAVSGAPFATVGGNIFQGSAYVFVRPGGAWANGTQNAKLVSGGGAGDSLGSSIAVSGDTVVAGAPQADVAANGAQGAVYVFVKPAGGWATAIQTAKLSASDGAAGDQLGQSVAVSGDTVFAGTPNADVVDPDQGAIYVFVKPGGGWASGTEMAKLTISDGAAGDQLGFSVAVSANTVAAGAPGADLGGSDDGAAYVFVQPVGPWVSAPETAKLTASDGAGFDQLGFSVAVSGDTVVAGAPFADVGASDKGAAYVFVKPGGSWASTPEVGKLTASVGAAGDNLGHSVAVSADTVAAGALDADGKGAAYVFVKPVGPWANATETAKLTASDGATGDQFGYSIALDASTLVAGAPNDTVGASGFQGSAYAFVNSGGGWASATQTKLTASDGATGDQLGHSVAVSGSTVAVAAHTANIAGATDEGAAYVYVPSLPTAVRLISFVARRTAAGVALRWRTATELGTAGFNVYREQAGASVRLNRTLLHAGAQHGATHRFVDRTAHQGGSLRYRLQSVGFDGTRRWLGTARA